MPPAAHVAGPGGPPQPLPTPDPEPPDAPPMPFPAVLHEVAPFSEVYLAFLFLHPPIMVSKHLISHLLLIADSQ